MEWFLFVCILGSLVYRYIAYRSERAIEATDAWHAACSQKINYQEYLDRYPDRPRDNDAWASLLKDEAQTYEAYLKTHPARNNERTQRELATLKDRAWRAEHPDQYLQ